MVKTALHSHIYKINDHDLVLDKGLRTYVLKVRDMPQGDKPREKLLAQGPVSLNTAELIAVILGTGTRSEEVMSMASRMVREYGEMGLASRVDVQRFATDVSIPLGKAMQVVAALELGRRFFQKNHNGVATIRSAQDVFEYTKDMRELPKEHLRGIYLNAHHKVIHDEIISIGTVNGNMVHPREVFRPALEYAAVAVILVHNHPSGETDPSEADIEITRQIVDAGKLLGIDLLDHVIITRDTYTSVPVSYVY